MRPHPIYTSSNSTAWSRLVDIDLHKLLIFPGLFGPQTVVLFSAVQEGHLSEAGFWLNWLNCKMEIWTKATLANISHLGRKSSSNMPKYGGYVNSLEGITGKNKKQYPP